MKTNCIVCHVISDDYRHNTMCYIACCLLKKIITSKGQHLLLFNEESFRGIFIQVRFPVVEFHLIAFVLIISMSCRA